MLIKQYNDPTIINWNVDASGNKVSVVVNNEQIQIINGAAVLNGIPDEQHRVKVGSGYFEINSSQKIVSTNQYKVDYTHGFVYFHPELGDRTITLEKYYSRGQWLIPATRVWVKTNDLGEVIETLSDVSAKFGSIENLIARLENFTGDAGQSDATLRLTIIEANALNGVIQPLIVEGRSQIPILQGLIADAITNKRALDLSVQESEVALLAVAAAVSLAEQWDATLEATVLAAETINTTLTRAVTGTIPVATLLNSDLLRTTADARIAKDELETAKIGVESNRDALLDTITTANAANGTLISTTALAGERKGELEDTISAASTERTDLNASISLANIVSDLLINEETGAVSLGEQLKTDLTTLTDTGITLKGSLQTIIDTSEDIETSMGGIVTEASTAQSDLSTVVNDAVIKKGELDSSILAADAQDIALNVTLDSAIDINETLSNIETGNIKIAFDLNEELKDNIIDGSSTEQALINKILAAETAQTNIQSVVDDSVIKKDDLLNTIDLAESGDLALQGTIATANSGKGILDNSIIEADLINESLTNVSTGSIKRANDINTTLLSSIGTGSTSKSELDLSISEAGATKGRLDGSISLAVNTQTELETVVGSAEAINSSLSDEETGNIKLATDINSTLESNLASAGGIKDALDLSVIAASSAGDLLDTTILSAATSKGLLEDAISNSETERGNLNLRIAAGEALKGDLGAIIDGSDFEQVALDIASLKTDQHTHSNKVVLDELTDVNSLLKYKGVDIGLGDMSKSVYDTNQNGKVDVAENSEKLGNQLPTYYAKAVDIPDITGKADKTYVDLELNKKANMSDVDATFLTKADLTYVDDGLLLKSDLTYVNAQLDLKGNLADVNAAIALKADQSAMTTALGLKADKTEMNMALDLKEDKTEVTTKLNLKADKTEVTSSLLLKADKTYVDAELLNKLNTSLKGAASGLAELDASGKVPASQLPSYVDDVLEFAKLSNFPVSGETGKIYTATDTNIIYRWSGTNYVEISASLALGTTSSTAYYGDKGKIAYDHSQIAHAPVNAQKNSDITKSEIEEKLTGNITTHSHTITKANVGLANVDNTSDLLKPISTATQTALNGKAATSHTHTKIQITDFAHTHSPSEVGLANVNNTSDANKPVSTAQQIALNLKADKTAITNVNNTSDMDKPISTAQQAALNLKADKTEVANLLKGLTWSAFLA